MLPATMTTRTSYGDLQGTADRGVTVFRGVPYARPPLGPLRFAPPQPPAAWTGLRDATEFGPPAMQVANVVTGRQSPGPAPSEDCLTLNIWTPSVDDRRRPVMVWLHGGAFTFGSGSSPTQQGAVLARRGDVVVVTINYRLGLFGYLRGIDVCGEALPSTGNMGLLDQRAALGWVQDEIAAFGGDPGNVTVFGQSAGAVSIGAMLTMPRARGLFQKAILQSGGALPLSPAAANRVMEEILADLGLAPYQAHTLRDLPAAQLLEVQARVTPRERGISYHPVVDGAEVPRDPEAAVAAGSASGMPVLIGTTLEEWSFFQRLEPEVDRLTDDGLLARLDDPRRDALGMEREPFDSAEAISLYRRERAARGECTTPRALWTAIMSDRRFRVPEMRLAELWAAHTPETYAYLFTWQSPGWDGKLGAAHGVDVPFVFGTLDVPAAHANIPVGSPVGRLSEQMQDAWVAFARTGSPRTPELHDWEPYSPTRRCTMLLGTTCFAVDAPNEAERRFWATQAATSSPQRDAAV